MGTMVGVRMNWMDGWVGMDGKGSGDMQSDEASEASSE